MLSFFQMLKYRFKSPNWSIENKNKSKIEAKSDRGSLQLIELNIHDKNI